MDEKRTGKVVKVLNNFEVVVNLGAESGVAMDDVFVVYARGEELKDPDTGGSLGTLEIVRGRARAVHVQDRLTTLRSIETHSEQQERKRPVLRTPFEDAMGIRVLQRQEEYVTEVVQVPAPFREVRVGDLVRRL